MNNVYRVMTTLSARSYSVVDDYGSYSYYDNEKDAQDYCDGCNQLVECDESYNI